MIVRKVSLLLTGGLILLSIGIGTGFAMKQRKMPDRVVLQTLEAASMQLDKAGHRPNSHQSKAMTLVQEAITEMKASLDDR